MNEQGWGVRAGKDECLPDTSLFTSHWHSLIELGLISLLGLSSFQVFASALGAGVHQSANIL